MSAPRLTKPIRHAIISALNAALAGDGFDGGDFDGENRDHYERALTWIEHKERKSTVRSKLNPTDPALRC